MIKVNSIQIKKQKMFFYGAMETPQHGNGPLSESGSVSFFFSRLNGNPSKTRKCRGISNIEIIMG